MFYWFSRVVSLFCGVFLGYSRCFIVCLFGLGFFFRVVGAFFIEFSRVFLFKGFLVVCLFFAQVFVGLSCRVF